MKVMTEKEWELIQKHIAGNGRPFFETEVEKVMYNNLIERAFAYERVFDGHEERMHKHHGDVLLWIYEKFNQQEASV